MEKKNFINKKQGFNKTKKTGIYSKGKKHQKTEGENAPVTKKDAMELASTEQKTQSFKKKKVSREELEVMKEKYVTKYKATLPKHSKNFIPNIDNITPRVMILKENLECVPFNGKRPQILRKGQCVLSYFLPNMILSVIKSNDGRVALL